jgi:hypothetical protein
MPSKPLPRYPLQTNLAAPHCGTWQVGLEDPARTVMTDSHEEKLVAVVRTLQVDQALEGDRSFNPPIESDRGRHGGFGPLVQVARRRRRSGRRDSPCSRPRPDAPPWRGPQAP